MHKHRLEAFSDGVFAILITILVLELKAPDKPTLQALFDLWSIYLAYLISFFIIYKIWIDHHRIFERVETVSKDVLWANGILLLTASQIPFVTSYVGETHWLHSLPVALYGIVMAFVFIAFNILHTTIIKTEEHQREIHVHLLYKKGNIYIMIAFGVAAVLAFVNPLISLVLYVSIPLVRIVLSRYYYQKHTSIHPRQER